MRKTLDTCAPARIIGSAETLTCDCVLRTQSKSQLNRGYNFPAPVICFAPRASVSATEQVAGALALKGSSGVRRATMKFLWWPNTKENGAEYSEAEIVDNSSMYAQNEGFCGVYFLLSCDEIVYIGQTVDLKNRLKQHWNSDKAWNRYFFIKCEREELNKLEAYYILRFRPKYNIAIPRGGE